MHFAGGIQGNPGGEEAPPVTGQDGEGRHPEGLQPGGDDTVNDGAIRHMHW